MVWGDLTIRGEAIIVFTVLQRTVVIGHLWEMQEQKFVSCVLPRLGNNMGSQLSQMGDNH